MPQHRRTSAALEAALSQRSDEINADIAQARAQRRRAESGAARSAQRNGSVLQRTVRWWDEIHSRNHIVDALRTIFGG